MRDPEPDDLADALERAADAAWTRRRPEAREASFQDALTVLLEDLDPGEALGGLGAPVGGAAPAGRRRAVTAVGARSSASPPPSCRALARRLRRAFAAGAAAPSLRRTPGVSWVAAELGAGVGPLEALIVEELGAGRAVVALVAPPLVPAVRALEEALVWAEDEPDPGVGPLVVVPAPDPAAALVAAARVDRELSERLIGAVGAARSRALLASAVAASSGARVPVPGEDDAAERDSSRGPAPALREESGPVVVHTLRSATIVVTEHDDADRAARRVARLAFGPDHLGGYLASAVGAVWVHARRFAAFHGALLEALEGPGALPVCAAGELADARALHERVRRLGLDEGATLIHSATTGDSAMGLRARADARGRAASVRAVFTNVDPASRLARELEPAGVLRVLRVAAPRPEASSSESPSPGLPASTRGEDGEDW